MYCKECGAEIDEGSKFCNHCGKATQGVAPTQGGESKAELIAEKGKSKLKGFLEAVGSFVVCILIIGIVFYYYADSQGEGKNDYACQLLTTLLHQNFGDDAAECTSFTVVTSPERGLWIPEFGVFKEGRDIGTAVLTNGTVMHDVIHSYKRSGHEIRFSNWSNHRNDYMKKKTSEFWD